MAVVSRGGPVLIGCIGKRKIPVLSARSGRSARPESTCAFTSIHIGSEGSLYVCGLETQLGESRAQFCRGFPTSPAPPWRSPSSIEDAAAGHRRHVGRKRFRQELDHAALTSAGRSCW